jgi:ABC-type multidrug transport system fused ATPase/permease subunit
MSEKEAVATAVAAQPQPQQPKVLAGIWELIRTYAASEPGTVAGFVVLLTAATVTGVVGLTKASATLSLQVSRVQKEAATVTVAVLIGLLVVLRLLTYGVDSVDRVMSTQFRESTTARLVHDVVAANRTTLQDVHPMRYRAYVEASVASSFHVFEACVKTYLPNLLMMLVTGAYLFYLDVRYGVALVVCVAVAAAAFLVQKRHLEKATHIAETQAHGADTFTYDVLSCMDTVVARNTHEQEMASVQRTLHASAQRTRELGLAMDTANLVMSGAVITAVAIITLIGVRKLDSAASVPAVLTMLGLVGSLRYRIGSMAAANTTVVHQVGRFAAHSLPPHLHSHTSSLHAEAVDGGVVLDVHAGMRVEFDGVSFKYPGTLRPVLSGFSWAFGPGGVHVLCAKSGSGKTTVARLLLRLYHPDAGTIRINGVPLRDVAEDSLRTAVIFSNQDMGLLDRTIREVCLYGTTATEQDLARVWDTFKDCFQGLGLDDRIGLSGDRMSTGMKQVIRLTNVRLSNAPCVVLDEPFSGLDAENRAAAIALVQDMAANGRTVFLITHEADVVLLADTAAHL